MRVAWWGHATTTLTLGGTRVLTDPVLVDRVAHLRRLGGATPPSAAARADVVVVSHLHADHLHLPSLRLLPAGTPVVAPRGTAAVLRRGAPALLAGLTEVAEDDVVDVAGVRIRAVHAHHDGRRLPGSRHQGPALGFVIAGGGTGTAAEGSDTHAGTHAGTAAGTAAGTDATGSTGGDATSAWFAGDTGLFDGLADIGPVDVAVVPVGGWGPTLGPHHLDPVQAADAVDLVGARVAVPVHYGTFWPLGLRQVGRGSFRHRFREPGARFAAAAGEHCPGVTIEVLAHGEEREVGPPTAPGPHAAGAAPAAPGAPGSRAGLPDPLARP